MAVLLMILATALGARGAGVEASNLADPETVEPTREKSALDSGRLRAELTPVDASAFFNRSALGNGVFPVVRPELDSFFEARELAELLLRPIVLPDSAGESTLPGVFSEFPSLGIRAQRDSLPGVAGSPRLLSSFAGHELFHDGPLSLEAGVQLPLFDDRPGFPEPEFILQFRLQF